MINLPLARYSEITSIVFEFDGIAFSGSGYHLNLRIISTNDVVTILFKSDHEFSVAKLP